MCHYSKDAFMIEVSILDKCSCDRVVLTIEICTPERCPYERYLYNRRVDMIKVPV